MFLARLSIKADKMHNQKADVVTASAFFGLKLSLVFESSYLTLFRWWRFITFRISNSSSGVGFVLKIRV